MLATVLFTSLENLVLKFSNITPSHIRYTQQQHDKTYLSQTKRKAGPVFLSGSSQYPTLLIPRYYGMSDP